MPRQEPELGRDAERLRQRTAEARAQYYAREHCKSLKSDLILGWADLSNNDTLHAEEKARQEACVRRILPAYRRLEAQGELPNPGR